MRVKISKNQKSHPNTHIFKTVRGTMRSTSQNSSKACQEPVMNLYTKFQLPSSIWREVMSEKNSKNLGATRGWNVVEKSKPPSRTSIESTHEISTSWLNLEGNYAREKLKKLENLSKTYILHILGAVLGCNEVEKSKTPKYTSRISKESTYQISTS